MWCRLTVLCAALMGVKAAVPADLITNLPGIPFTPSYKMYSGYLNGGVMNGSTNHMFYWHAQYQFADNGSTPVIFWFNGGPGCSSLGGFFTENGPFWPSPDGATLFENPYGWNKVGHTVHIESPPGTGFSYPDNLNTKWNDDLASLINAYAINDFFVKYPEFAGRQFFITGESYAGVYIPTMTGRIIDWIKAGNFSNNNFGGFAIGNGYMDQPRLFNALMNYNYYHGFFGDSEWAQVKTLCCSGPNANGDDCDFFWPLYVAVDLSNPCVNLTYYLGDVVPYQTIPDEYNVYQSCYVTSNTAAGMQHVYRHTLKAQPYFRKYIEKYGIPKLATLNGTFPQYPYGINTDSTDHINAFPCYSGAGNAIYLSRADVQAAIHVSPVWQTWRHGVWRDCDEIVNIEYTNIYMQLGAQFNYALQPFNAPGGPNQTLRLMIYNGDVDTVCNFLGDEWFGHSVASANNLNFTIIKRGAWYYRGQLAGEAESLGTYLRTPRLDILTVNGAGHFVPMDRQGPALQMLYNFVNNRQNYSRDSGIDTTWQATNAPSNSTTTTTAAPGSTTTGSAASDKIFVLPGLPYTPSYDMYSGYLDGGMNSATSYNHIFYWLNEYQFGDNDSTPVVVWMNGGPGCSSLGGLFTENGPFYAYSTGQYLFENIYGWNKAGNVLYIESPPGVGFSYSDDLSITWSDDTTSLVNVNALNDFFKKHSRFANRKWYITGESYGGKYVPTLSVRVKQWIEAGNFSNPNFQGFAIGNGCCDDDVLFNGQVNYFYYHGLFGQDDWNNLLIDCCGSINARGDTCDFGRPDTSTQCNLLIDKVYDYTYSVIPDAYNIYQSCYQTTSRLLMMKQRLNKRPELFARYVESSLTAKKNNQKNIAQLYNVPDFNYNSTDALQGFPCWADNGNALYLGRADVQQAIHVSPVWQNWKNGQWSDCSNLRYTSNYDSMQSQMVYLLQGITPYGQSKRPLHLMLYNGDVDIVCNFLGEEWYGHNVVNASGNQQLVNSRQAWFYERQLAGYQEIYTNFEILTVNGAGHFVPMDRPGPALQMLNNYLQNTQDYTKPFTQPSRK